MITLNKKVIKTFSGPFAQTYNSINDIRFRHNLDGVMIPSNKGNNAPGVALPSPPPPHFPKKLIVSFFILLLLITPTKKNK